YVRSAEGGAGYAKNAGNYGAAMYPTKLAQTEGYNQLIWTDASQHQYVEESGTMNALFVIDGKVVTPALSTSILDGVTRRSVLQLARDMGLTVEERKVGSREVMDALAAGKLNEAFGVGTAATIAPMATIGYEGQDYDLPEVGPNAFSKRVGAALDAIRTGEGADVHNWMVRV
ncbi:MAG TPA: aminotransferase class IV, partial [Hymenobacter sp.]|uniref:aminotransferase class IV n=1 Tax=Hymenobacter sp. TaxID=1898978 RepID=UPI002ED8A24F